MEHEAKLRAICGCGFDVKTGKYINYEGMNLDIKDRTVTEVIDAALAHATTRSHTIEFHGGVQVLRGRTY
jgi:hypothetical protein